MFSLKCVSGWLSHAGDSYFRICVGCLGFSSPSVVPANSPRCRNVCTDPVRCSSPITIPAPSGTIIAMPLSLINGAGSLCRDILTVVCMFQPLACIDVLWHRSLGSCPKPPTSQLCLQDQGRKFLRTFHDIHNSIKINSLLSVFLTLDITSIGVLENNSLC